MPSPRSLATTSNRVGICRRLQDQVGHGGIMRGAGGWANANTHGCRERYMRALSPTPIFGISFLRASRLCSDGLGGALWTTSFLVAWHRALDDKAVGEPTSVRVAMETFIHNLLTLGEDVFVSWASD